MRAGIGIGAMAAVFAAWTASAAMSPPVRETLQGLLDEEVAPALKASAIPKEKTVAVLPIAGDESGLIQQRLKSALSAAGLKAIEGATDPLWDTVLKEVEWDERKADMLDPATLVKFGKLKATQVLLYGFVRNIGTGDRAVFVEIELHASSVETKEHVWGQVFARRFYVSESVQGVVRLNEAARRALSEAFGKAEASLKGAAGRLGDVKTAALTPVAGDLDRYVTGRVMDLFSASTVTPRELNVRSVGEAELLLRAQPDKADGIVHGALRDLSSERKNKHYSKDGFFMVIDREVRAEVQLQLRGAKTGDVVWSVTAEGIAQDPERITWSDLLSKHPKEALRLAGLVLGGLLALILVSKFLSAMRRVR